MSHTATDLEDIFHAASELGSPEERRQFLQEACGENEELRREVEALLRAVPAGSEYFKVCEDPVRCANATGQLVGSVIGRYKLLEQIGEGGMGVVYMAEQQEPVRRKVAFKMIKLGMDTQQVVARFEAERQALAMMDHPHIAQVLDGGATEMGRPYFVMELVQGVAITKFCEANHLSIEARLKLFITVCHAIQSAHQKGIIHRDIKPSNVLVTMQDGIAHPMVIDFGVARAINQKLTDQTVFTRFATMIGTPAYMSPEQAEMSKSDMDTRSDIYSLGVLLYELLTGTTPFSEERFRNVDYGEMQRVIAQEQPQRPSTRLKKKTITTKPELRNVGSRINSDLDWIAMKCLEKDRKRRYETAAALAADIQAYLASQPVTARPPSRIYRFQKFTQRNRGGSVAAAVILVAVIGAAGISIRSLIRERSARKQSDERLRSALVFVDDVFNKVAPQVGDLPGSTKAQSELGQAGLTFLQNLRESAGENPALRGALARLYIRLSDAQNTGNSSVSGDYDAGLESARKAIELLSSESLLIGESERLHLLAWAKFNITQCLYAQGRIDEALGCIDELDSMYNKLRDSAEFGRSARRDQQSVRNNAGYNLILVGRAEEAIERFLLPILKSDWARTITTNSAGFEVETVMNAHANMATAHYFLNQFEAMLPMAKRAVQWGESLGPRFPLHGGYACKRAAYLGLEGYAAVRTGASDGLDKLNKSREEIEKLLKSDAQNEVFRFNRAVVTSLQASAYAYLSRQAKSAPERARLFNQAKVLMGEVKEFANAARTKEPSAFVEIAEKELGLEKAAASATE